jgi:hypothetical protein
MSTKLSKTAIQELLDSKEKLADFSTVAIIHAITQGLHRIKDPKTAPTSINQFIDQVRKVRADLTGDNHQAVMPQMMVNIQFGQNQQPVAIDVVPEKIEHKTESLPTIGPASPSLVDAFSEDQT